MPIIDDCPVCRPSLSVSYTKETFPPIVNVVEVKEEGRRYDSVICLLQFCAGKRALP